MPKVPVTMNHELTRPGLNRNAGMSATCPRRRPIRRQCERIANASRRCSVLVEICEHAFGIAFRDGGRVGIRGIDQELDRDRTAALQVAREVVRHNQTGVEFAARDGVANLIGE